MTTGVAHAPHHHSAATLRDYLQVVRRRKWIVLQAVVIVPIVAALLASRQPVHYRASADVLLSDQSLASALTGLASQNALRDGGLATQADVARIPLIADRAVRRNGITARTADQLLGESSVAPRDTTNILTFTVTDADATLATRLANAYANEYARYRHELDTNALLDARRVVERQIATMRAAGQTGIRYQSLVQTDGQLAMLASLQGSNATVIREAGGAARLGPATTRDGILGLILGLGLGLGLAFLRESLDTRVRSAAEIGERIGLPLLARIPEPPRRIRNADKLVMIEEPGSAEAEPFRILRTNLQLMSLERDVRTIMVTSALEQEGKSTTAANLAVALARGGQDVALIDLDLRSPYLERFFTPLHERRGVTQVVLGHDTLDDALFEVRVHVSEREATIPGWNGMGPRVGRLEVLFAGHIPPDPGEFMSSGGLSQVLEELRARADVVIVDTPPILHVGDAIALSPKVDALIVVTRIQALRRQMLVELHRLLETTPVPKLGYVATGAQAEDDYAGTYYASYYGAPVPRRQETAR